MFKEAEIRTFIEGTTNYFETSAQQSATVGSPAAYVNAVIDALSHLGITNIDMPVTSDKVWAALRSKGVTE